MPPSSKRPDDERDGPLSAPPLKEEAVRAGEWIARLWAGKWAVLALIALGILVAGVWLKTMTAPRYAASMVIAPARETGTEALARQINAQALPAIMSGPQFATGPSELVTSFDRFLAYLTSIPMAERLQRDHGVLQSLFAGDWDVEQSEWRHEPGFVESITGAIKGFFGQQGWQPPTPVTLAGFLKRNLVVYPVGQTGLRTVEIRLGNPELAQNLLGWVYAEADRLVREKEKARVEAELEYLRQQFEKETVAEYRDSLLKLIAQRQQTLMIIELDLPFVAERIEGPTASEAPVSPHPVQSLVVGGIVGAFAGLTLVFFVADPRRWRRKRPPAEPY